MNILWIASYPVNPKQHPAPWILMLAKELVSAGHQLTILTPSPKIKSTQHIDTSYGYHVILLPFKGGILHLLSFFKTQIKSIRNFLKNTSSRFDIIHVHGTEVQFATSLANLSNQGPYIISMQGIISLYKKELSEKLSKRYLYWTLSSVYEKMEIRKSKYFFCRTEWDQTFVKKLNEKAEVFECWEVLRSEFFDYKHAFEGKDIIFMGGDNPLKAVDHCLQVFNELVKEKDIKLHIVGAAANTSIKKIISEMNLSNISTKNIVLHGNLDAEGICEIYKKCFCLYHPSLIDNSPNSVCEAQVAGLPVIATSVGGVPSLIQNGVTGLLVAKNDLTEHVEALIKLFADHGLQRDLSRNAMKIALPRHDKKTIVLNTISTYQKLAQEAYA